MNPRALSRIRAIAIASQQNLKRGSKIAGRVLGLRKHGLTPAQRSATVALKRSFRDPFNDGMTAMMHDNRINVDRVQKAAKLKLLETGNPQSAASLMSQRGFLNSRAGDVFRSAEKQQLIRRTVGITGGAIGYGALLNASQSKKKKSSRVKRAK